MTLGGGTAKKRADAGSAQVNQGIDKQEAKMAQTAGFFQNIEPRQLLPQVARNEPPKGLPQHHFITFAAWIALQLRYRGISI